jgi:hypothetical protein
MRSSNQAHICSSFGEAELFRKILYNVTGTDGHQLQLASLQKTPLDLLHCLFTTPLVVITIFLVTMSSDPLMSCLGEVL